LAVTRCGYGRNSLSFCNLVPYSLELVPFYQYFDRLDGIPLSRVPFYGGSVELADFCPFYQTFTWRDPNAESSLQRDSRCELDVNTPDVDSNAILESYGDDSRCFDLAVSWTERRCGRVKTYVQYMAGCYGFVCDAGRLHIRVGNDSADIYPCYFAGQLIHIRRWWGGWLKEGKIICPPCEEICVWPTNQTCDADAEPPFLFVGDPPLAEPCRALRSHPPIALFALIVAQFFFFQSQKSLFSFTFLLG